MANFKKIVFVTWSLIKILILLYFFICSLDLMSTSFKLLAGKETSEFLGSDSEILSNPIVGLMIGILGTVLVQSSSTFTSIIISMVGGGILEVSIAVPMIMGANIGTSVTNTIVSLTQVGDRTEFGRAFAAATVHDMFNWCTVIVMLTIEIATGFLEWLSNLMATGLVGSDGGSDVKILEYITDPFCNFIVQIDSGCLEEVALNSSVNCNLQKDYCPIKDDYENNPNVTTLYEPCRYVLHLWDLEDWEAGLILLICSLTAMILALLYMVKLLNGLLEGTMAKAVKKVLNPSWKNPIINYLYGYFNIIVGAFMTFIVQSSSVFTSTLTPLVGIGLITVETVYPLFLGANIGTTTTGLLAAMTNSGEGLHDALQISFVHLLFNVFGILLYYPIPFMRIPLPLCKLLGKTTAQFRWFAIAYLIVMFLLLPFFIMVCSLNTIVFFCTIIPLFILLLVIIAINVMQRKCPRFLPAKMRNWDYLPKFMRSLEPLDRIIVGWSCCASCNNKMEDEDAVKIDLFAENADSNSLQKDIIGNDDDPENFKVYDNEAQEKFTSDDEAAMTKHQPKVPAF